MIDRHLKKQKETRQTFRSQLKYVWKLWKESLKFGGTVDSRKMQRFMLNKTWFVSIIVSCSRVYFPLIGIAYWQTAYDKSTDREAINHDFVDASKDYVQICMIALISINVLLNIVIYWYRDMAKYVLLVEGLIDVFYALVPVDYGDFKNLFILLKCVFMYTNTACNCTWHTALSLIF